MSTETFDMINHLKVELAKAREGLADVSRMTHQLADIDQIVTEAEKAAVWHAHGDWLNMLATLRAAVDGTDYKPKEMT